MPPKAPDAMSKDELIELLKTAKQDLLMQSMLLDQLATPPIHFAPIIGILDDRVLIAGSGGVTIVEGYLARDEAKALAEKATKEEWTPEQLQAATLKQIRKNLKLCQRGKMAQVSSKTFGLLELHDTFHIPGQTAIIKRVVDEDFVELESSNPSSPSRLIYFHPALDLHPGDQVVLDPGSSMALRNLGKPQSANTFKLEDDVNVSWAEIGGLDSVIKFFWEVLVAPSQHADIYQQYGHAPPKGVLLFGPPGCGKTLVAKAVATQLAQLRGLSSAGFFSVKGPEILSPWVGVAEERIRNLFSQAKLHHANTGSPAVIFIDEAEAVMSRRGSSRSSDVDKTIVPSFLTEMDGIGSSGAIVLLATNRPDMLDPAITREGRIDRKVKIPRPTEQACLDIFRIHLSRVPLTSGLTADYTAQFCAEYLFAQQHVLCTVVNKNQQEEAFTLGRIASGALCSTVVNNAAQRALSRDIEDAQFRGIRLEDLAESINELALQNSQLSHDDDLKDTYGDEIASIIKRG